MPRFYQFYECAKFLTLWPISATTPHIYYFEPFQRLQQVFTILSHFYECAIFLPFWAILRCVSQFYHFKPFLRLRHIFTILSHLGCAEFLPSLRARHILTFWPIFTGASYLYHFESFLRLRHMVFILIHSRVRHISTILRHFYKCSTLLRFWGIFANAPHLLPVFTGSHKNSNYKTIDPSDILRQWCIRAAEN